MDRVVTILNYIFGANPGVRFKRILLTLIIIMVFVMGFLNLTCGVSKTRGWYIMWAPGAEIKINK